MQRELLALNEFSGKTNNRVLIHLGTFALSDKQALKIHAELFPLQSILAGFGESIMTKLPSVLTA